MAPTEVKAWEDTIVIPTYERGPEDPNPPLLMGRRNPIHPGSSIMYPYPLQETLFNRKADRKWRILYLENSYLKLGVSPELGGRLLFLFNKSTNEEAIYHNHVLKWARIGIRGAWVSGGIEWNFPNGHTVTSSSPIDCAVRRNDDGSASLLFGDIERVSRMRWSVAVTLYPERAFFETEMRLTNRTVLPNRYWFWANSSAPVSKGMEYISTASKVFTLKDVMSFPVHDGVDIHWDKNHVEAQDMFCLNPREEFVGWYNQDLQKGLVNVADRTEARGTKFFTWGGSDDGAIWGERLTDTDGPYAEMQSGRFPTMGIWEILSPCSEESWKEVWYPVVKIGAPVFANREAAFALSKPQAEAKRAGLPRLGVQVTRPLAGARLAVQLGNKVLWERKLDLAPETPFSVDLPASAGKPAGKDLTVTLTDPAGETLARWLRRARKEPERPVKGYIKIEPTRPGRRAEEQWLNGRDFEKLGDFIRAAECYREALKTEPGFSPALIGMGVLNLRQGLYAKAMEHFQNVLLDDPANEAARFYLAACHMDNEQFAEAIEELKAVMRSRPFRAGAAALLGGLYLSQGENAKAVEQLTKCVAQYPWNQEAGAFLACALRRQGEGRKAQALVEQVLARDPLHLLSLAEAWFLAERSGSADRRLAETLRGEVQSYLELACDYARVGLYPEAYEVLARCVEERGEGRDDAMACYHLGYYAEKLGRKQARLLYRRAQAADPALVFPHRLESERVLRRALKLSPRDGRARYYLGNLLCAKGRAEEAIALWEQALQTERGLSVLHRNLGRTYWKVCRDPDRAIAQYRAALQCAPMDYKLYFELDCILVDCALHADRRELMARVPPELMQNDVIAERVAMFHADYGDFDRALEILRSGYFYPWEIYKGVRLLYVDSLIGKGLQLEQANKFREAIASYREVLSYPRNIGVGEPHYKANAEALYRIALALERDKDKAGAQRHWQQSAREKHTGWSTLDYYQARALQKLGQRKEAGAVLAGLLDWALKSLEQGRGDTAENHYLAGLALKGKGERAKALGHFHAALGADPGHRRARWELSGFIGE
jgi:tetratricopeptide (TPR) repeat protein